jgi:hypothetical protein
LDWALITAYLARMLPSLVGFLLSLLDFNYRIMVAGVKENEDSCPFFQRQQSFSCLRPGARELTILNANVSIVVSYFVSALLAKSLSLASALVTSGFVMTVAMVSYVLGEGRKRFRLSRVLIAAGHSKVVRAIGPMMHLYSVFISFVVASLLMN